MDFEANGMSAVAKSMEYSFPPARNEARERMGDSEFDKMHIDTKLSITKSVVNESAQPVIMPIYHSSNYRYDSVAQWDAKNHGNNYIYQRCGNPTVENVEVLVREMEGGAACLLYNSGLAAISGVFLEFLSAGDHLICMTPLYSGPLNFLNETMSRFGVETTFVKIDSPDFLGDVRKMVRPNTKMIYLEVIANPTVAVPDLEGIVEIARKNKIRTVVDATLASPYLLKPLAIGCDISIHSTKYISGHNDLIGGTVTTASYDDWARLKQQQLSTGSIMAPMEASMIARGIRTLPLRMEKICNNAQAVAEHLSTHPKVTSVHYPGLKTDPGHALLKKHMKQFGGMIGFEVATFDGAIRLVEGMQLVVLAMSLGGTESCAQHPASMTHGKQLFASGGDMHRVPDGLIRLSVGVEDAADIIADLDRALELV